MSDAGYVAAGYLLTAAVVAAYGWSLRLRHRRARRLADRMRPRGGAS